MKRMWSLNQLRNIADVQAAAIKKDITTLVDKDGHDRFIEGDIEIEETTGITKLYGRWSLSGTHLMIVLALAIADATALTDGQVLAYVAIPEWVYDKIYSLIGPNWLDNKVYKAIRTTWSQVDFSVSFFKESKKIKIQKSGNFTASTNNVCRIVFDMLIDNE